MIIFPCLLWASFEYSGYTGSEDLGWHSVVLWLWVYLHTLGFRFLIQQHRVLLCPSVTGHHCPTAQSSCFWGFPSCSLMWWLTNVEKTPGREDFIGQRNRWCWEVPAGREGTAGKSRFLSHLGSLGPQPLSWNWVTQYLWRETGLKLPEETKQFLFT